MGLLKRLQPQWTLHRKLYKENYFHTYFSVRYIFFFHYYII